MEGERFPLCSPYAKKGSGMSRAELLDAFVEGRIGRREFIQGLVGTGVALAAAAAHAAALKPAAAQTQGTIYGGTPGAAARARAQCKRDAVAVLKQEINTCQLTFRGKQRATCIQGAKLRYEVAQQKCNLI
jgi:hypothetical protein